MSRATSAMPETLAMFDLPESGPAPPDRDDAGPVEAVVDEHADAPPAGSPLPAVLDVETAGRLLGLGRSAAYQLVKEGAWPTPVLRLGHRWRVLTAPLLALLGIDGLEPSAIGARLATSPTAPAIFRHDQGDQR